MSGGSVIDAYNLALSYIDRTQSVQSLTEPDVQAGICNRFWDRARKVVLEQAYWSFATRSVAMTLLMDQQQYSQNQQINPGWRYIYSRPGDALRMQAVTTAEGLRINPFYSFWWRNSGQTDYWGPFRPPWTEVLDFTNDTLAPGGITGQSLDILTDEPNAWAIYTVDPPNLAILPETFLDCCAWQLAIRIAGPLAANQKAKENAVKMAELSLTRALAQNLNEQQPDPYPQSPSIQARL
jgi:hypothetical protein